MCARVRVPTRHHGHERAEVELRSCSFLRPPVRLHVLQIVHELTRVRRQVRLVDHRTNASQIEREIRRRHGRRRRRPVAHCDLQTIDDQLGAVRQLEKLAGAKDSAGCRALFPLPSE